MGKLEETRDQAEHWAEQARKTLSHVDNRGVTQLQESLYDRPYAHLAGVVPEITYAHACAALSSAYSALHQNSSSGPVPGSLPSG
ncbi:MAG TPA: hypothetical protein VEP73_05505 [Actinomycetota bacterium]|nr:hypothetical protein [Actinomycetota bacterium]